MNLMTPCHARTLLWDRMNYDAFYYLYVMHVRGKKAVGNGCVPRAPVCILPITLIREIKNKFDSVLLPISVKVPW